MLAKLFKSVRSDDQPLEKVGLFIFETEIERQCRFAILAYNDLVEALKKPDMDRIWYSVQGVLIAAGNVSKLLWPSNHKYDKRGEELRASLQVPDNSPLQPRIFRNHFEHFDERLDDWVANSRSHNFIDSNVAPSGGIAIGHDQFDYLRNLDTTTEAVTFRGDTYQFKPMIRELDSLWQKTSAELRKFYHR